MKAVHACILFLLHLAIRTHGQVFTSIVDLERVLQAERDLSFSLKEYVKSERDRLDKLEAVAEEYQAHATKGLQNPSQNLGNLVSSFLNVKRFTVDWQRVSDKLLNSGSAQDTLNNVYKVAATFPCDDDLATAAQNLFRLQDTYALTTEKMATGDVPGAEGKLKMTIDDIFQIGKLAYNKNDFYHTILWVEYAMERVNITETSLLSDMYDYLNFAYYQQGNIAYAAKLAREWLEIDHRNNRAFNNLQHYELMLQQEGGQDDLDSTKEASKEVQKDIRRPYTAWTSQDLHHVYEAMCRGEKVNVTNPFEHRLYCSFQRPNPIFYLAPLKEEILHMDPLIRVFHDVLAPSEKKIMKELALPRLHRSVVFADGNSQTETEYRISKTAWIPDNEHPTIKRISTKAGIIAGLNLDTVELLQVLNYGIGGHYEPHFDFSTATDDKDFDYAIGNRIATVIFYIEDVEAGGATAFPEVGVRVKPEAGAAGLWYNLFKSGQGDRRTIHGACPVLAGTKWVATKWFHERGQEFFRPCDVNPQL